MKSELQNEQKMNKNNSATSDAVQTRLLINRVFIWMASVLAGIFIVAIISLLAIKNHVNVITDRHDDFLIRKAVDKRQENIRSYLKDNAEWGEAYNHLHKKIDIQWAWDKQNLGQSLYDNFGYEGVFVISPDGITSYSVIEGKLHLEDIDVWTGKPIKNLLYSKVSQNQGKPVSVMMLIDSVPAIISAGWITTGNDASVSPSPGRPSMMIFIEKLTTSKLLIIGNDNGISNVRTAPERNVSLTSSQRVLDLKVEDGFARIVWDSDNPGEGLIILVLPLLILSVLLTLSILLILMRHIKLKARVNDEHVFLLDQARLKLIASEKRFRDVSETTSDWLWETDATLKILWLSDRFSVLTGFENNHWIGRQLEELFPSRKDALYEWLNPVNYSEQLSLKNCPYSNSQHSTSYCSIVAKFVVLPDGSVVIRGAATDVTLEVEANKRLQFLSRHDELTGLPNRRQIKEFLEGKLSQDGYDDIPFAMICLDLDKFKPVNDLFGHATGDALLGEVSARLRGCVRSGDFVARQGGDEFMVLLTNISTLSQVDEVCQRIVNELNRPFIINDHEVMIGVSLGVSMAPADSISANDLLRYADIALYQAKQSGRNRWVYYSFDMSEKLTERRKMEEELRTALREKQFYLVYQPRFNLKTSQIDAVEALVRWQHPARGILMPDQFITLAEETGLIIDLSNWVLSKACIDVHTSLGDLAVSVNISPVEFQATDLAERLNRILSETGLSPERLEIEVTENVTLTDPEKTRLVMDKIKSMGVRILIDDFGTGYASLSYLRKFHFDGLKLDKSFIHSLQDSDQNQAVVEKIISLGKAYSLDVTAEGVETAEQYSYLKKYNCDEVQGYYIGKPVPFSEINASFSVN